MRSVFQPPSAITIGAVKPLLRAIVAPWCSQVMEAKISQPSGPGGSPEHFSDLLATVGPIIRAGEDPCALVALELVPEDLPRGVAENHGPRAGLGLGQQDDSLLQVAVSPPQVPELALAHERERRELRDLSERCRHCPA